MASAAATPGVTGSIKEVADTIKASVDAINAVKGLIDSPRGVVIEIDNATSKALTLSGSNHSHGNFAQLPAGSIHPMSNNLYGSHSTGFLTGTEGTADYAIGDGTTGMHIHWDNPYAGGNSCDGNLVGSRQNFYYFYAECGGGNTSQARFVLIEIPQQAQWRYCNKCAVLWYDGFPNSKGVCRSGGSHEGSGSMNFSLVYDFPTGGQPEWRYCNKCAALYYNGYPSKGVCPAGGGHDEQANSLDFILTHDSPNTPGQQNWRFCNKCSALYFDGFPDPAKGACAADGYGHDAQSNSFQFVLTSV